MSNSSRLAKNLATVNGWLLLALLFIAPIFFDRRLAIVFSGSKIGLIRIVTLAILLIAGISLLLGDKTRQKMTGLHWRGAAYFIAITISTLLSIHPWVSFIGAHGRYEGWLTLLNYGLLFLFAIEFLPGKIWRQRLIGIVFLSGVIESIYGMIQRHGVDPYQWGGVNTVERIIGTIGQPNFVAAHIAMAFLLSLSLLFDNSPAPKNLSEKAIAPLASGLGALLLFLVMIYTPSLDSLTNFPLWLGGSILMTLLALVFGATFDSLPSRWKTGLLLLGLAMMGIGILYTQSRGGVIGWLGGIALFLVFFPRSEWIPEWKKLLSVAAILVILLTSLVLLSERSPLRRMAQETTVETSTSGTAIDFQGAVGSRFQTWKSCLRLAGQYPFFGIGPETIKMLFPQVEMPLFRYYEGFHIKQDRAHNEILDTVVTKGNIGLLLYVFLLAGVFHWGVKRWRAGDRTEKIWMGAVLGMLAAYLIQNQFSFGVVAISTLFWVGLGLITQKPEQTQELQPGQTAAKFETIPLLRNFPWGDLRDKITELSFPRLLGATLLLIVVFILMAMATIPYRADIAYKRSKIFYDQNDLEAAEREIQKAVALTPREAVYQLHSGVIAFRAAGIPSRNPQTSKEAIRRFERGTVIDPYTADNHFFIGRTALGLVLAGHEPAVWKPIGITASQKALALDPYFSEAWETLGYFQERDGDLSLALTSFVKAFEAMPVEQRYIGKIIELSQKTGRGSEVIATLKKLEAEVPSPANILLLKLEAELYRMNRKPAEARLIYDKLLRDHPADVQVLQGAALLDLQSSNVPAAFEKLQRALIEDPQNPETQRLLNLISKPR